MTAWITALRIARREARRAKGRSALVLAMISLPVMLLSFAAVLYDTMTLTPQEKADRRLGQGEAVVSWIADGKVGQSPDASSTMQFAESKPAPPVNEAKWLSVLPPGSRVTHAMAKFDQKFVTPHGHGITSARSMDVTDPLFTGTVSLLEGQAPKAAGEVGLTEQAASWLQAKIGDTIRTAEPEGTFTVTGIVEFPDDLSRQIVFTPAGMPNKSGDQQWLVDAPAPITWADVQRLNELGIIVVSKDVLLNPPPVAEQEQPSQRMDPQELLIMLTIAVLGTLEIILLAGPAFAVGARRRARDLALVAAAGGEPKHLRRIVLADGVVLGSVGAGAGIAAGIALAFAARPYLEELLWHNRGGNWRFFPLALLAIALFAVITGLLAAIVPAFTAARQDVVTVLAGRRGVVRSRKRWVIVGLALIAAGTALAIGGGLSIQPTLIMAGIVIGELGLVIVTPGIIGLISRLGRFLPLSSRIALRDTARNRTAAAPAISAIMAAVIGALVAGVFSAGSTQRQVDNYRPSLTMGHATAGFYGNGVNTAKQRDWDAATRAAREVLPTATVYQIETPSCDPKDSKAVCFLMPKVPVERLCPHSWELINREPTKEERDKHRADPRCAPDFSYYQGGGLSTGFIIDDGEALAALTGADAATVEAGRKALADGAMIVHDRKYIVDGKVTVVVGFPNGTDPSKEVTRQLPAFFIGTAPEGRQGIISHATAAKNGMRAQIEGLYLQTVQMPTEAEREKLAARMAAFADGDYTSVYVERGPLFREDPIQLVLAAIAALIALGAAGIATGLAAADSRADLITLGAIGAAPGVRRRLSLSQAGVISGLGTVLGTVIGLGTAAVFVFTMNQAEAEKWPNDGPIPYILNWQNLLPVLAVPIIAMIGAGLLTRSRIPSERPRLF